MTILVPYETSGQQLGETRLALTKHVMKIVEETINHNKSEEGKYYVLIHAKPMNGYANHIIIKSRCFKSKPPMMLSCLLFGVDNEKGNLTLEWALPGDWPVWSVGGTNEPVPETIASVEASGIKYHYENFLP